MDTLNCTFCAISHGKKSADILYEDTNVIAILGDLPVAKGHVLVIWKRHVINVSDLSKEEYTIFSEIFYNIEKSVLKVLDKNRSIILKSGGLVPHFHFHIYPVTTETPWPDIQAMIDRKSAYTYQPGEKEAFLTAVRESLEKA